MLCHQARKRLTEHNWRRDSYGQDAELTAHLEVCDECRRLAEAEAALQDDLGICRKSSPLSNLTLQGVRDACMSRPAGRQESRRSVRVLSRGVVYAARFRSRPVLIAGVLSCLMALVAFVPFNFEERVGYEIAIAGVDRCVAEESQDLKPFLSAMGMEPVKAVRLLDSLGGDKVRLNVGDCAETCQLRISDLKTERDVRLVVNAIVALGCCQIDRIAPIVRRETTSLLMYAARRLYSEV